METGNKIKILITFFIVVIIALVFLTTLNQSAENQATLETVTDDTFTSSNTACVQITSGCIDSITTIENNTGSAVVSANYTLCRSNSGNKDGVQVYYGLNGLSWSGNTLNATYIQSADCSYNSNATSRNLTGIVIILFVIAIVVAGIVYFKEIGFDFMGKE